MRRGGFTLIEMLTVVAIFGVVAIYVGRILTVNERAYHNVENTSESQQNLRVFGELVEDNLRHAGMMVPRDGAVCGRDYTNAADILYASDAAAIDPQNDSNPYSGPTTTSVTNLNTGSPFAATTQTLTLSSLILEPSPPSRPAYDTDNNGTADSDFRPNGGVIVFDPANLSLGNACGRITAVNVAAKQITVRGVTALAGAATSLVAIPANEYYLNGTQLQLNGFPLADGIEDFQVGYVFDFDKDNVIDTGGVAEERRAFAGVTGYTSSEKQANLLREVRVGLVSRARQTDATFSGRPQALLNRAAITTADGYRRRTYESRVLLRNLSTRID
jgi:prepilin-type N-terminal cleavage/methylation domain-containing protein